MSTAAERTIRCATSDFPIKMLSPLRAGFWCYNSREPSVTAYLENDT